MVKALLSIASFALLSAAALTVSSVAAQEIRDYQPPCGEALRLAPDAFGNLYVAKTNDGSEAGLDQAALHWASCKRAANLEALKAFPVLKARLVNLTRYTERFIGTETELAYLVTGGGAFTLYAHSDARFQPLAQLHLAQLIALTTSKAGAAQSSLINRRYAAAKLTLEERLKRVQTPKPFVEMDSQTQAQDKRKQWLEAAQRYNQMYQNIRKTIGSRVDATSVVVIEFLADGLWAEEL